MLLKPFVAGGIAIIIFGAIAYLLWPDIAFCLVVMIWATAGSGIVTLRLRGRS